MLLSEITFKSFLKFRIVRGKRKREKRAGGGEDKKKSPKKQNRDPARNLSVSIRQGHTRCEGCGALAHKRPPRGRGTGAGVRPVRERLRCPPRGSGHRHNVPLPSRSRSGSSACPPPHIYYYFLISSGPLHAETRGWRLEENGGKRKTNKTGKIPALHVISFFFLSFFPSPGIFLSPLSPHNSPAPSPTLQAHSAPAGLSNRDL